MPEILGCFNTVAMVLCAWLLLDGRRKKKSSNPLLYDFYRGCELHPRLFGCDVKQLTNCRIGLILWQVRKAITSPNCYFKK
jgi:7-dehydrocholesterol reductase